MTTTDNGDNFTFLCPLCHGVSVVKSSSSGQPGDCPLCSGKVMFLPTRGHVSPLDDGKVVAAALVPDKKSHERRIRINALYLLNIMAVGVNYVLAFLSTYLVLVTAGPTARSIPGSSVGVGAGWFLFVVLTPWCLFVAPAAFACAALCLVQSRRKFIRHVLLSLVLPIATVILCSAIGGVPFDLPL